MASLCRQWWRWWNMSRAALSASTGPTSHPTIGAKIVRRLGQLAVARCGSVCRAPAIGEGIESTAAAVVACGVPGWAALSAGGIRALILPPEATHVLICADHDTSRVGARAAHDAAARWLAEGRRVRIAMPPVPDTDMADALVAAELMEARHVA
jgi:hypothetical protein